MPIIYEVSCHNRDDYGVRKNNWFSKTVTGVTVPPIMIENQKEKISNRAGKF